jgi:diguanylate cyclase (GGDEF)-like protein
VLSSLEEKLLEQLITAAENLSMRRYGDNSQIFAMTDSGQYPPAIARLAEAFGMMAVKVAAREYHLEQIIADLTKTKDELKASNERLSLDTLTRIPNRWAFTVFLEHEWGRSIRFGHSLAAIMIDIDHFKDYNDFYGHLSGDECLCRVAEALHRSCKRSTDLVARYGGEEFVAILPVTDCNDAAVFAEKLRASVAELAIPHSRHSCGYVTISLGVASMVARQHQSYELLLNRADQALYQSKNQGRNRVTCHLSGETD